MEYYKWIIGYQNFQCSGEKCYIHLLSLSCIRVSFFMYLYIYLPPSIHSYTHMRTCTHTRTHTYAHIFHWSISIFTSFGYSHLSTALLDSGPWGRKYKEGGWKGLALADICRRSPFMSSSLSSVLCSLSFPRNTPF